MRWLSWLRARRAPRAAIDPRRARAIIEAYGACLEQRPAGVLRQERELPYSKEEIGRAILLALRFASGPETVAPLRRGFIELEQFLDADEWSLVDEYQRGADQDGGAAMASGRRETARRILAAVDERRLRRLQLLAVLDRESGHAARR